LWYDRYGIVREGAHQRKGRAKVPRKRKAKEVDLFDVDRFIVPDGRERIDPAVLDLAHLDRYTMGDRALERELLTLFLGQTRQYADRLPTIRNAGEWKLATHSIKGTARSIGAGRVAASAQALEEIDPAADPELTHRLIAALGRDVTECEAIIGNLLARPAGQAA
jgi:HPt (histidine-containing phosphotransfer) domain-containing protein